MESKESGGGLGTLAAELQVDLSKAMRILLEVQDCLAPSPALSSTGNGNSNPPKDTEVSRRIHDKENLSETQPTSANTSLLSGAPFLLTPPPMLTASDLISSATRKKSSNYGDHTCPGIISFCRSIDNLFLPGGIPLGSVTEIAGLPGVGKTQLAMQLAVNARLPRVLGGVEGHTLYIDSEGSLVPERLYTIAQALLQHTKGTSRRRNATHELPAHFSSPEKILEGIHVFRVHDEASQAATLYSLPHWIENFNFQHEDTANEVIPVKLIIIDSIAFHYRAVQNLTRSKSFYLHRTHALTQMVAFLNNLARDYNVAVVCLNQMTTKIGETTNKKTTTGISHLVPALGEAWAHCVTTRLLLSHSENSGSHHRICSLVKSPCMPAGSAAYQVAEVGVRDVPCFGEASRKNSGNESNGNSGDGNRHKRVRLD